jgi:hypothetical protein
MFVGGIGASPALAVLNKLRAQAAATGSRPPQTTVVFVARDVEEFTILDEELVKEATLEGSWLNLQLFHTGSGKDLSAHSQGDSSQEASPSL